MKKLLILLTALTLGFGVVACGSDDNSTAPATDTTGSTAQEAPVQQDGDGSGGVSPDSTEAQDGNQMGDDNSGGASPDSTQAQDGNQMGDDN